LVSWNVFARRRFKSLLGGTLQDRSRNRPSASRREEKKEKPKEGYKGEGKLAVKDLELRLENYYLDLS